VDVTLRPFRAGNFVQVGSVSGMVQSVHVFSTTLLTVDNKEVIIPNGKIIAIDALFIIDERLDNLFNVRYLAMTRYAERKIDAAIGIELAPGSLNFTIRVWVKNAEYWDTYFDFLENIKNDERLDNLFNVRYLAMTRYAERKIDAAIGMAGVVNDAIGFA
jgi:small conductance mechanosensitive channel